MRKRRGVASGEQVDPIAAKTAQAAEDIPGPMHQRAGLPRGPTGAAMAAMVLGHAAIALGRVLGQLWVAPREC